MNKASSLKDLLKLIVLAAIILWIAYQFLSRSAVSSAQYLNSREVKSWSIDGKCFVQGFTRINGTHAVMSCGGYGDSRVILVTGFDSAKLSTRVVYTPPSNKYFMEGCTIVGNRLFVLTWREHIVFELSLDDFSLIQTHSYSREGWGITYNPEQGELWASDGSSSLFVLDPGSLRAIRSCKVTLTHDGFTQVPVKYLNELEYIDGTIFANVYMDTATEGVSPNYVLGIDPESCKVKSIIPAFGLGRPTSHSSVFNGIAQGFNPGELLVTGKLWKRVYAIKQDSFASNPHANPLWSQFNITDYLRANLEFR